MTKLLLGFSLTFLGGSFALAGGDSAQAKILKVKYLASGKLLVAFKWNGESGFIDGTTQDKLLFDLYNFGGSRRASETKMPKSSFEDCANMLIDAYRTGGEVELGQMGGDKLIASQDSPGAVVVPYAKVVTTKAGTRACLVVAEPIK